MAAEMGIRRFGGVRCRACGDYFTVAEMKEDGAVLALSKPGDGGYEGTELTCPRKTECIWTAVYDDDDVVYSQQRDWFVPFPEIAKAPIHRV